MTTENEMGTRKTARLAERAAKFAALFAIIMTLVIAIAATANAEISLVSPQNNTQTNSSANTFDYHTDLNATLCTLLVDGSSEASEVNPESGFNSLSANLNAGEHYWKINCTDSNLSQESESRRIIVDQNEPTIVLFSPADNSQFTTRNLSISFVAVDNYAPDINCSINLDGNPSYSTVANNSAPVTISISSIADGLHNWSVSCKDYAQNTKTSEARKFTINATPTAPQFGFTITRREYYTGEQGTFAAIAPNLSSVRVEVCPDISGFVECNVPLNVQNSINYPIIGNLPYMNKEGKYVIEAYFTLANYSETKVERYNVTSNIAISISAPELPRKNEPIILDASAVGGVGSLNYTWTLSNGSKYYAKKVNITYSSSGNYTNTVAVSDSYNNTRNQSIALDVSNSFTTRIILKDEETSALVAGATIEIDTQRRESGTNGEATLYVRSGKRELTVLAQNYSIYSSDLNITGDATYTILLKRYNQTLTKPVITLTYPANNQSISGSTTEVGFNVQSKYESNCSVYISEDNTGFFISLGSSMIAANDQTDKRFEIIDLENKTYYWKVECIDSRKSSAASETRAIQIGRIAQATDQSGELGQINTLVKELETALTDLGNSPTDLKDGVEALGYRSELENAIKNLKNAIRDLDALNFKQLSPEEYSKQKLDLLTNAQSSYSKAPVYFELLASDSFVDYIESSELEQLAKEYIQIKYGSNSTINLKRALKALEAAQQEAVLSTKTKNIRVTFKDGSSKELSLVMHEVKTYNLSKDATLVEVVPKDVASSAKEIRSNAKYEIVKEDPILSFPLQGDATISYYVEKIVDKQTLRNVKTAVFIDISKLEPEYVTGFSITDFSMPQLKNGFALPIIIVLLAGLVIGFVRYEGVKVAQYTTYLVTRKNTLHYVNVIISDINDNLQVGNLQRAAELYEEAKSAYSDLPHVAKNDIYETIAETARKIEAYHERIAKNDKARMVNDLMISAERSLGDLQVIAALEDYKKLESLYHELDPDTQALVLPHLSDLGNKIQILIASNKKGSYE